MSSIDETRYAVLDRLDCIEAILCPPRVAKMIFVVTIGGIALEVSRMQLKVTNKLPLSIKLVDKFGNTAPVDGVPQWALSNPGLGSLVVAADGMSAEMTPTGPLGSFLIQVSADADMGSGVTPIFGELPIDLIGGDAVSIQIVAGEPVPA
jgi:hypothetical protein